DGIRDATVTGVQTCALPISCRLRCPSPRSGGTSDGRRAPRQGPRADRPISWRRPNAARTLDQPELPLAAPKRRAASVEPEEAARSEERRVGTEWRAGGWACA